MQALNDYTETFTATGTGKTFRPGTDQVSIHLVSNTDGGTLSARLQLLSGDTWIDWGSQTVATAGSQATVGVIPGARYRVSAFLSAAGSMVVSVIG